MPAATADYARFMTNATHSKNKHKHISTLEFHSFLIERSFDICHTDETIYLVALLPEFVHHSTKNPKNHG